ncbi:MAG: M28 family metallopeptidase [Solirubrobacterales bacterium]
MPSGATQRSLDEVPHLDQEWLRDLVETLSSIHRPTASLGERRAAEWLLGKLRDHGASGEIQLHKAHGTFWWPLGLAAAGALASGVLALRGRRVLAGALAAAIGAAAFDDLPPGGRRFRGVLPQRTGTTVVTEMGPPDAERTVVLVAHHDAAHAGLVYHPAIPQLVFGQAPWLIQRVDTSPPLLAPVVVIPALIGAGAATGNDSLVKAAMALAAVSGAALADIGRRGTVPGANDNATGIAVLVAIARALAEAPTRTVRVMLVSTSEEALCEGMQVFAQRHFGDLPHDSTFFLSIDTVGSPHLLVLRGEGMIRMREYPARSLELLDGLADELGIDLFPNLRLRNATDGIYPLAAGYECASLCSCTDLKQPANYHWPTDTPENVDYGTVSDAVRLTEAMVRRLDERWL